MFVTLIVVAWIAVSVGFVLGCAWAAAHQPSALPQTDAPFADPDQKTPWSATAQLAAMDGPRVRDVRRREEERVGREADRLARQYPHLTAEQVRAIALRRRAEQRA